MCLHYGSGKVFGMGRHHHHSSFSNSTRSSRARHASSALSIAALAFIAFSGFVVYASQDAAKPTSVADGVFSSDQATRGQMLYNQSCSSCHQADLAGADQAPGLAGGDFLDRWDGQTVADLVDRIRTSMPADNVGSLNTETSTDIVAYILQVNSFPAGTSDLKADRAFLKTVLIKRK
jgi:mono/diheme cytochrome c family protein